MGPDACGAVARNFRVSGLSNGQSGGSCSAFYGMKPVTKSLIGAAAWIAFVVFERATPGSAGWSLDVLLFGPLVLMPLALDLLAERRDTGKFARTFGWLVRAQLPAALVLGIACALQPGFIAFLLAVPWAVVTMIAAGHGLGRALRDGWSRPLDRLAADAALVLLVLGGLWILVERAGLRPLGYDDASVALGSVFFFYTAFLAPLFGGMVLRQMSESRFAARAIVGAVLGVPAFLVGALIALIGWTPALEAAAGFGVALSGMIIAILHVRWSLDAKQAKPAVRLAIGAAGVALFFAMVLAGGNAIRSYVVVFPNLDVAQLRAALATLLAVTGLCGVLGWRPYAASPLMKKAE